MSFLSVTITGIWTGFCSGIGGYLAVKYAIARWEKKTTVLHRMKHHVEELLRGR